MRNRELLKMSQIFLIYISNRTDPNDAMLVRDIAIEASQTNRTMNISGILMAVDNYFLQVLEGQEREVETLLDKIAKDPRHTDVQVLYRGNLPDRIFGQWSMGCVQAGGNTVDADKYLGDIREEIQRLCENITQEKSEQLKNLIIKIPQMLSEDKVKIG